MTGPLSFLTRLWFCWVAWFRVLFDGAFAARVFALWRPPLELAPKEEAAQPELAPAPPAPPKLGASPEAVEGALQLLALLQREGRLIDFVQQDITTFPDSEVGAAARVVHEGCRRALRAHAEIVNVRGEAEGARVVVNASDGDVKLTGNVSGAAPYRGVLRHRGWRVEELRLPTRVGQHDAHVVAPAEVEL
ncbi:MAG TPA: DUF2760 domain-containing protein [Polyangiaceae bacterium]|nr:DUF2760 domain-containing protein [Polyangiaceae bacterium]